MIFADKIIQLRKKNGWSQEELAEKMNVSRQAVSKWEAAQSTPDLEKILQLSKLFGVTTDYLLKDEIEDEEFTDSPFDSPTRKISLAEAHAFLEGRRNAAVKIAVATLLCILSPVCLLLLIGLSEFTGIALSSQLAVGVGLVALFLFIAIAVSTFIRVGFQNAPYEFLEKVPFETEYGVTGLAKEKQKIERPTYIKYNILGAVTCILSPLPIICAAFTGNELVVMLSICLTLLVVGIGVMLFIVAGVRWASMQKLLKEGEYSKKGKISETVSSIYWLTATAIYLGWSFLSNDWQITWVIWPIAAILFSVVELVCNLWLNKNNED